MQTLRRFSHHVKEARPSRATDENVAECLSRRCERLCSGRGGQGAGTVSARGEKWVLAIGKAHRMMKIEMRACQTRALRADVLRRAVRTPPEAATLAALGHVGIGRHHGKRSLAQRLEVTRRVAAQCVGLRCFGQAGSVDSKNGRMSGVTATATRGFKRTPQERPNPSFERTHTGKPPWPPSRVDYHRPLGQCGLPVRSAQLKR
jgi:hypothetical protein